MRGRFLLCCMALVAVLCGFSCEFSSTARAEPSEKELAALSKSRGLAVATFTPAAMAGSLSPGAAGSPGKTEWTSGDFHTRDLLWVRLYIHVKSAATSGSLTTTVTDSVTGDQLHIDTLAIDGPLDREIAVPMIASEAFKVAVEITSEAAVEPPSVEIREVLVLRSANPETKPEIKLGDATGELAYVSDQKRIDMFTTRTAHRQSVTKSAAWENPKQPLDPALPEYLQNDMRSVVRLSRKAPNCAVDGLESAQVPLVDRGTIGCTAFRVGSKLFATAWHCMSSDKRGGCLGAKIEIGYDLGGNSQANAVATRAATENCQHIVYENRRIDLTIFEVTEGNKDSWQSSPVLQFLDGNRIPFTGEEIAILHYPSLSDECHVSSVQGDIQGDFQVGLRVSRYSSTRRAGDECHVLGDPGDTKGHKYLLDPPRDPRDMCEEGSDYGRKVAFGHRCATCVGSSGSPVISISSDPERQGRVIGVHVNGINPSDPRNFPNRSVRSTVIADCLDTTALYKDSEIKAAAGASKYEYCGCDRQDYCMGSSGSTSAGTH